MTGINDSYIARVEGMIAAAQERAGEVPGCNQPPVGGRTCPTDHPLHGVATWRELGLDETQSAGFPGAERRKHAHYFKDVSGLKEIDVYRVLDLFDVTDQTIGHAIKKLLVAGGRGVKDIDRDVQEAIDTLQRWQEMRREDAGE